MLNVRKNQLFSNEKLCVKAKKHNNLREKEDKRKKVCLAMG